MPYATFTTDWAKTVHVYVHVNQLGTAQLQEQLLSCVKKGESSFRIINCIYNKIHEISWLVLWMPICDFYTQKKRFKL